jgi:hypothetical protein
MVSVPVRVPVAVGLKVTFTVQAPDGVIVLLLHISDEKLKSPELVPVIDTAPALSIRLAVPVLVTVTVVGELDIPTVIVPRLTGLGENPIAGKVPAPLRLLLPLTEFGVSMTVAVALRDPIALGLKVADRLQFAPAASVDPQVPELTEKSLAFVPVTVMDDKLSVVIPVFSSSMLVGGPE